MHTNNHNSKPVDGLSLEDLARGAGLSTQAAHKPRTLDWILVGILIGMALSACAIAIGARAGIMAIS